MLRELQRIGESGANGRGRLGIILYTSPSSYHFRLGIKLAKAALAGGYDVEVFAWGDAVYATTVSSIKARDASSDPAADIAGLLSAHRDGHPTFTIHVCTTCYKTRGLSSDVALQGTHLGGLHNVVEMFQSCDRTLMLVP